MVKKADTLLNWAKGKVSRVSAAAAAAAAAKSLQSCPTLCNSIDGSPPGSPVPGILQARTLEWVAISFSNAWKWKVKVKSLSRVWLFATPWTAAYQAPPSMGFPRQDYWSGVPLPSLSISIYIHVPVKWLIQRKECNGKEVQPHSCKAPFAWYASAQHMLLFAE